MRARQPWAGLLLVCCTTAALAQQWNPQLAARYLDAREQDWFDWKISNASGAPCLSCHTGLPYLMVRPVLRRALHEVEPTKYETGLLSAMRSRDPVLDPLKLYPDTGNGEPTPLAIASQSLGVEALLASLTLALDDAPRGSLSAATLQAFDRLWSLQRSSGDARGSWHWNSFDLDPYEMPESSLFGASLAALAVAATPADYRSRSDVQSNVALLKQYLRSHQQSQPLHHRLLSLWAARRLGDELSTNPEHRRFTCARYYCRTAGNLAIQLGKTRR